MMLPSWVMALGAYGLLVAGIVVGMVALMDGTLGYTLDDPFIHLALAERIARGHYGINLDEVTAPSSSVIWPFLMLPGVGTPWHVWLPLAVNLISGAATAVVIGLMVDRLPWGPRTGLWRAACVLLLVVAGNLAALPFTGMEHSPQVLIAAVCALAITEAMRGRPIPLWCLAAAAFGPALRYEMFALIGALMVALAGQRRWLAAAGLLVVSLVPPVAFGAWLVSQGLPPLPNSVLAKSEVYAEAQGLLAPILALLGTALHGLVQYPPRWPYLGLALLAAVIALRAPSPQRWPLLGALAALALHALVGRFGWFFRYEIYALLFGLLVVVTALATAPRWLRVAGALVLLGAAATQSHAIRPTPRAAQNIYDQQYQMHRFVAEYWGQGVAVNDLGWVSYRVDPGKIYVLDLWGLASNEALQRKHKDAPWLDEMVRRRGIRLAMIYPSWFEGIPDNWTVVGILRLTGPRITPAGSEVFFYATEPGAVEELREKLRRFAPTLPRNAAMEIR